ncbi:ATP-binding protein [Embleya sp. AB8]|uniref:ATP-binding protein n=1 Tax=Embleya sp. AB8 TaxID=3156304 RepID=UPI003C78E6BE
MAARRSESADSALGQAPIGDPVPTLIGSLYEQTDSRTVRLLIVSALGLLGAVVAAVEAALHCATELHTNAVVHTEGGPTSVEVWHLPTTRRALVVISDSSPTPPIHRITQAIDDENGRGLTIVESLSDDCGYVRHDTGKHVWFTVNLSRVETAQLSITPGNRHTRDQRHHLPNSEVEGSRPEASDTYHPPTLRRTAP